MEQSLFKRLILQIMISKKQNTTKRIRKRVMISVVPNSYLTSPFVCSQFFLYLISMMNSILFTFKVKASYYLPLSLLSLLSSQRKNKMQKRNKFALKAVMFCKRINKRYAQYNRSIDVQKTNREGREIHAKRTFK